MPTDAAWSTTKFLLVALAITFVFMFTLNLVLNVILDLGVNPGAFAGGSGVVIAMLLPKWGWFRRRILERPDAG